MIVDDVSYFEEPFFQDGPVAVAINDVVASGVSYFSAAGNDNLVFGGRNFSSWETPQFRDSAACPPLLLAATGVTKNCLDFDPGGGDGQHLRDHGRKRRRRCSSTCNGPNPGAG